MTVYNYTKSPVAIDRLTQEIQTSTIVTALDYINLFGSDLNIYFVSDLSTSEKTLLDLLVSNHAGLALTPDFVELSASTTTNTSSSSYVLLDSMQSPALLAGTYFVTFTGILKTNAPALSSPGFFISLFSNGVQVPTSEISDVSGSVSLFSISPIAMNFSCSVTVGLNQKLEVRWKTNGAGNTLTCLNRVLDIMKIK